MVLLNIYPKGSESSIRNGDSPGINKRFFRVWHQFFDVLPRSRQFVGGIRFEGVTPKAARFCCRRWWFRSKDRGGSRSQVLQGLLSLFRVTVVAVAVGPLAKGLVDAHVSLRVDQTLLISGEEAKPLRKEGKK